MTPGFPRLVGDEVSVADREGAGWGNSTRLNEKLRQEKNCRFHVPFSPLSDRLLTVNLLESTMKMKNKLV